MLWQSSILMFELLQKAMVFDKRTELLVSNKPQTKVTTIKISGPRCLFASNLNDICLITTIAFLKWVA
uniref:Uncharacterized protein n=1 Tax=Rhizophora mucronata TaxID=61149 RepID=A0A2P2NHH2_RHIMU